MLIDVGQLEASEKRYDSWITEPEKRKSFETVSAIEDGGQPSAELMKDFLSTGENLVKRIGMLSEASPEPVGFAYERAIGVNDAVYSNFCELISMAKQKVGRIAVKTGSRVLGYATGFMVSEKLLLTNWHVFQNAAEVMDSEVQFGYELDILGRPANETSFRLDPSVFFHAEKGLDYCLVAVSPNDVTGTVSLSSVGYFFLDPRLGKLGEENKELLNIIHHPEGDYKQLSIRENKFTRILPNTVWYQSDTAQGSSGSPVFNDQWQVVALHHMGVPAKTPDGKNYITKDGKLIVPVNGKVDIDKIFWIANEGVRISKILEDVFKSFPASEHINGLKQDPSMQTNVVNRIPFVNEQKNDPTMDTNNSNNVQISFPASLIATTGNISIQISNKLPDLNGSVKPSSENGHALAIDEFSEIKKIDRENAVDYSVCKGYISSFMGVDIPMPKLKKSLLKFAARQKSDGSEILKYHHYTVMQHITRKMPIISAINVDGNDSKRKDRTERVDIWLRDTRIDYAFQLDDKFYANSGFDKGHMSRREDANWGNTAELAKKYADLTCMYTNACPQVAALNQSKRKGLWGKLEIMLLEKGVTEENGKASKISVFNGPVFSEDDPIYNGIQVPLEFWKIIVWYNGNNELKATAFTLSQTDLVGDILFEELDFDSNIEFKEYQCSIKSLGKRTKIDFSDLEGLDTFSANGDNESMLIHSEEEFRELITAVER